MSDKNSFQDDERFDGLYLNVAQTTRGIEPLLDTVFSFLRRKTDFFAGPPGADDGPGAAIAKVNDVLRKHAERYQEDTVAKKNKKVKQQAVQKAKSLKISKRTEPDEEIIEMENDGGFDASTPSTSQKPVISSLKSSTLETSKKEPLKEEIPKTPDTTKDAGDGNTENEEENDGPPPAENGGTVPDRYVWTQTLAELTLNVSVPENTRGRDVQVDISRSHLKIFLKQEKVLMVDDDFTKPIICDDSFWTIEDGNRLVIHLQKLNQMEWWESVCKEDPIINVRQIRPENSKISDLDGETRKTVEKMMFDQRQKAMGLPSSDEQTKLDALDMFKKQHPEMDFSNAKIS